MKKEFKKYLIFFTDHSPTRLIFWKNYRWFSVFHRGLSSRWAGEGSGGIFTKVSFPLFGLHFVNDTTRNAYRERAYMFRILGTLDGLVLRLSSVSSMTCLVWQLCHVLPLSLLLRKPNGRVLSLSLSQGTRIELLTLPTSPRLFDIHRGCSRMVPYFRRGGR